MKDFWNKIDFEIAKFVGDDFRNARRDRGYSNFLLIRGHTGSGKTWTTMKYLEDNNFTWIYLPPFHTNITDNLSLSTLRHYDFVHLQSRRILCELDYYKKIAEKNINIRPICEYVCALKDNGCPYYERKKELYENPKSWAGVHHHITSFLPEFFAMWKNNRKIIDYYDVIVIDENPIPVFYDMASATPKSLAGLKQRIDELELIDFKTDLVIEFLDYLILEYYKNSDLDYRRILKYFNKINFKEFYDYFQQNLVEFVRSGYIDPKDVSGDDYLELFSEMQLKATKNTLPWMIIKTDKGDEKRKSYYLTVFKDSSLVDSPLPIIGLDGTANIDIWKTIVGEDPITLDKKYKYKNMYQLKSMGNARYPFTSWVRYGKITETGKRLCRLINAFCKTKKYKVLIATTIPLQNIIKNEITAENIQYCHFYYLRSRNDFYEKSDSLVVLCEPNIPPFRIESLSNLSNWDEEVWRQVFTQEEIVQSVGRLREDKDFAPNGRKRENREILLLPYALYPNGKLLFPEAKQVSEEELKYYFKYGEFPIIKSDKKKLILEFIPKDTPIFKKEIEKHFHDKYGWSYYEIRGITQELMSEEKLIGGGRKGIKRRS